MQNHQNDSVRNPVKKKFLIPLTLQRFGLGGIVSVIITLVLMNIIWLIAGKGTNLQDDALIVFDVIGGAISLVIGGICGLILGGIWKNNKAPIIGGIVIGVIGPILLELVIPLIFGN